MRGIKGEVRRAEGRIVKNVDLSGARDKRKARAKCAHQDGAGRRTVSRMQHAAADVLALHFA